MAGEIAYFNQEGEGTVTHLNTASLPIEELLSHQKIRLFHSNGNVIRNSSSNFAIGTSGTPSSVGLTGNFKYLEAYIIRSSGAAGILEEYIVEVTDDSSNVFTFLLTLSRNGNCEFRLRVFSPTGISLVRAWKINSNANAELQITVTKTGNVENFGG